VEYDDVALDAVVASAEPAARFGGANRDVLTQQ
jgi:hypothetical protein